jgi:hypothetical protein
MHCDSCGRLLEYNERIVALRDTEDGLAAGYAIEREGGSIEEAFRPVGKYHADCYAGMREQEPERWPGLP